MIMIQWGFHVWKKFRLPLNNFAYEKASFTCCTVVKLAFYFYQMFLQLAQVLPTYFEESRKQTSEVWGKDLRIEQGERVKIVAPSGSGKTSLMHFIYGIRHEYSGQV